MEIQTDLDANVIDNVNNCEVRRAKHAIIFTKLKWHQASSITKNTYNQISHNQSNFT